MKKIQIRHGRVHWIFTLDQLPVWSPDDIEVVDYPSDGYQPQEGDSYEGGVFSPANPEPTLADLKAAKLAEINAAYSAATQALAADYPEDEQKSWPVQIMEARALVADSNAETPWIDAAASDRGITREALADLIIAQDTAYRVIHGGLSGTRQRLRDEIEAAESREDLDEINWP